MKNKFASKMISLYSLLCRSPFLQNDLHNCAERFVKNVFNVLWEQLEESLIMIYFSLGFWLKPGMLWKHKSTIRAGGGPSGLCILLCSSVVWVSKHRWISMLFA